MHTPGGNIFPAFDLHAHAREARDEDDSFHAHPIHQLGRPRDQRKENQRRPQHERIQAQEYGDNCCANHLKGSVVPCRMPVRMRRCFSVAFGNSVI